MSGRRCGLILAITFAGLALTVAALARPQTQDAAASGAAPPDENARLDLDTRLSDLKIEDGAVILDTAAGRQRLDGDALVRAIETRQGEAQRRPILLRLGNVESWGGLAWVGLGLLGQLMFMGRMLAQWLASERHRRSVVPTAFWWMSLCGGSMVLIYFIWRRDPVGILGQSMGWTIYARNLWLIYRPGDGAASAASADPAPGL